LIASGEDIARFYDDAWFRQQAAEFEPSPHAKEIYNANTPLMGFFFLPMAGLSYDAARHLTSEIAFGALLVATLLLAVELEVTGVWRAAAFTAVFAAPTTFLNLSHAHVYPLVLLLLVLGWLAWRRCTDTIGGAFIGLVIAFKTAGLFLVPLIVLERRWRALLGAMSIIGVLVLLTSPYVRPSGWAAYFHYASALMAGPQLSDGSYLSVIPFTRNLFSYNAISNPDPYFDAPLLALSLQAVLFIVILGASARVAILSKDRDVTFALFIMLSLILVPVTNRATVCLGFLPAFVIFSCIKDRIVAPIGAWFFLGGILSFGPGIERVGALADWGGPIFLYARFLGLLILMGVLLALGRERKEVLVSKSTRDSVKA